MSKVEAWLKFEARRRPMLSREEEREILRAEHGQEIRKR